MLMKSLVNLVLVALFLGLGLWGGPHLRAAYEHLSAGPAYRAGNYEAVYREAAKPVVMFSTSTCPYCVRARDLLSREGIDFQDVVVDRSPEAKRRFEAQGGGAVPLLFIGDRRIVGYREDTIRESLALIRR